MQGKCINMQNGARRPPALRTKQEGLPCESPCILVYPNVFNSSKPFVCLDCDYIRANYGGVKD